MRNNGAGARSSGAFVLAIAAHVLAVIAIPEFRQGIRELVGSTADIVEVEAEAPPEPPAPPPPRPERNNAPREASDTNEPPPPVQESTAPPPELLTTLDNVNLSNSGFTVQQGTGVATQPIRVGVQSDRNTDGSANGVPDAGVPGGTGLVADADLSVRAGSPSGLDALLNRFYPADARQQAVEGRAIVAIEVRADGTVGRVRRLSESVADFGFAQACINMVRESGRWTPGRDRDGTAVSSVLRFSCDFSIRR